MDEDKVNPSEINSYGCCSFLLNKALNTSISEKKRKLQAEQLGLPISKHKCWDHRLPSESSITLDENRDVQKLIVKVIHENEEMREIEDGASDPESAKGSNSFIGDSDSAMSVHGDVKFETEIAKIWPLDRPSTSSASWGYNTLNDSPHIAVASVDAAKEKLLYVAGENSQQIYEEEPILEFSPHLDYSLSEYGDDGVELYPEKEINNMLFTNGVNSNVYVLSSGRWNINQDAQPGVRRPTIDQEFEQYFSSLML